MISNFVSGLCFNIVQPRNVKSMMQILVNTSLTLGLTNIKYVPNLVIEPPASLADAQTFGS